MARWRPSAVQDNHSRPQGQNPPSPQPTAAAGPARETRAWGIPGSWSSGQQGAPAVRHGHPDPAVHLGKSSVPAAPASWFFP